MAVEIIVPPLGESVTEATIAKWLKKAGDAVEIDEALVELETDKVTLEVNSPSAGVISEIAYDEGSTVEVGFMIGKIDETATASTSKAAAPSSSQEFSEKPAQRESKADVALSEANLGPAVRKLVDELGLDPNKISGTGKDGRVTKGDIIQAQESGGVAPQSREAQQPQAMPSAFAGSTGPREERVKMTRLRQKIAERLKDAQNTAAILTTFNEIDMSELIATRNRLKDNFEKKHGIKLGFMSFFTKAVIVALKEFPAVNAEIDGSDLVYKNHYDISVAVGTPQGLVVPVIRDADLKSFAGIESEIATLGKKARDGKLTMADLTGGTFTISNGGVYGSLLSTPILNPPQSGILGMHKTQNRPVAIGDKIEIRPMMYVALSYDHRVIDGREAVSFLVRVKECLEDPQRILLDM